MRTLDVMHGGNGTSKLLEIYNSKIETCYLVENVMKQAMGDDGN